MKKRDGRWACAEQNSHKVWDTGPTLLRSATSPTWNPAAVLSLNTFDDWGGEQHFRRARC